MVSLICCCTQQGAWPVFPPILFNCWQLYELQLTSALILLPNFPAKIVAGRGIHLHFAEKESKTRALTPSAVRCMCLEVSGIETQSFPCPALLPLPWALSWALRDFFGFSQVKSIERSKGTWLSVVVNFHGIFSECRAWRK